MTYFIDIVFHFFHKSGFLEVFHDLLADIEAVHADIHAAGFRDCAVVIEDVNGGEIVFVSKHIVVDIMRRSNLETSCSKVHLHIIIHDDRHCASHHRHNYLLSFEPCVAFVVGVHTHSGISKNRLGTRGGYNDIFVRLSLYEIAQVEEMTLLLFVDDLFIG